MHLGGEGPPLGRLFESLVSLGVTAYAQLAETQYITYAHATATTRWI